MQARQMQEHPIQNKHTLWYMRRTAASRQVSVTSAFLRKRVSFILHNTGKLRAEHQTRWKFRYGSCSVFTRHTVSLGYVGGEVLGSLQSSREAE